MPTGIYLRTEYHKRKCSENRKKRICCALSEETKNKISIANKGQKRSEEIKKRLSVIHKGMPSGRKGKTGWIPSAEWRMKQSLSRKGIKMLNTENMGRYIRTEKTRKIASEQKRGVKNPNWNNGSSFEPYSVEFTKALKQRIRERDKYICQECGFNEGLLKKNLHIHHIDYNKKNNYPNNLISLCNSCHMQTNFKRNDWIKYFIQKVGN